MLEMPKQVAAADAFKEGNVSLVRCAVKIYHSSVSYRLHISQVNRTLRSAET